MDMYEAAEVATELIVAIGETEEPPRRHRVRADGTVAWRFKLGQCVSHRDQSMPSLVVARHKAGKAGEIYGVRSFATVDPNRDRTMLGNYLVDVALNSGPCHDCILLATRLCRKRG